VKRYRKIVSRAVALALCALVIFPAIALAIDDPDDLQATDVYVYDDLLDEGDVGVLIDYFIDYTITGNPTETANEAYLGIFIDTDGVTQLKSVAPYAYDDLGYGRGLIWIYFTAAEVVTHGIDRANLALYKIWLTGNPTLTWAGDPPKVITGISYWQPVDTNTAALLALRIMSLAQALGTAWTEILYEETALGARLTAMGEDYFTNTIPNLRDMAPNVFSAGTSAPVQEDLDYSTAFGATITDGTGTLPVSPLVLAEGANTVTITGTGTFLVELVKGTEGTAESDVGGAVVTSSPVDLRYGVNTITVTQAGTDEFTITVNLVNTQTAITGTVTGTPFDLSDLATRFGLSTMMLSGMVWLVISIIICAGVYRISDTSGGYRGTGGKTVLLVFDICIIGGGVLGMMPILVAVLMFIGFGALTGYVLSYRGASF